MTVGAAPARIRALSGRQFRFDLMRLKILWPILLSDIWPIQTFSCRLPERARLFQPAGFRTAPTARCGVAAQTLDICTYENANLFSPIDAQPILAKAIMAVRYLPSHYHRL